LANCPFKQGKHNVIVYFVMDFSVWLNHMVKYVQMCFFLFNYVARYNVRFIVWVLHFIWRFMLSPFSDLETFIPLSTLHYYNVASRMHVHEW